MGQGPICKGNKKVKLPSATSAEAAAIVDQGEKAHEQLTTSIADVEKRLKVLKQRINETKNKALEEKKAKN